MAASRVPVLQGFATIAHGYDLLLCDVWGVLHDGRHAHGAASEALARFRALPGERPRRVVLVSNAPRLWSAVQRMLDRLQVPRAAYDAIVTSGDLTRSLVAERLSARPDEQIHLLGPERDRAILAGLDVDLVPGERADCVVCTGPVDTTTDAIEDYRDRLAGFLARGTPMICANPDLVVEYGDRLVLCAGSIAAAYEAIGGEVVYAGKPHALIYEAALRACRDLDGAPPPHARILAIGDAVRTDMAGAAAAGIAALFVADGIHAAELGLSAEGGSLDGIGGWLAAHRVEPAAVMARLAW